MQENLWAALAPKDFKKELEREIEWKDLKPIEVVENLFLFSGPFQSLAWAEVHWRKAEKTPLPSISQAAKILKPLAKKWVHHSGSHHRRGELILEQLRSYVLPETEFPALPSGNPGVFTLLSADSLLYSLEYDRPHPLGEVAFKENLSAPSRAYLKLWEALALLEEKPKPGERCLELGASPGGWTWVIAREGASVLAVDRAKLHEEVLAMPGVEFRSGDAFRMTAEEVGPVHWLFSDLICYPEKLFEFLEPWIASGKAKRMICTLKFQGEADPEIVHKFEQTGRVLHLHHNKHELTWIR